MSNITKAVLQERLNAAKARIEELEAENTSLKAELEKPQQPKESLIKPEVRKMLDEAKELPEPTISADTMASALGFKAFMKEFDEVKPKKPEIEAAPEPKLEPTMMPQREVTIGVGLEEESEATEKTELIEAPAAKPNKISAFNRRLQEVKDPDEEDDDEEEEEEDDDEEEEEEEGET